MSNIYYNPETFTAPTKPTLTDEHTVFETDPFYRLYAQRVEESREAALKSSWEGFAYFFEDGFLIKAYRRQPSSYIAVTSTAVDPGINWSTYFATTLEMLIDTVTACYSTAADDIRETAQLNEYGLWEIQMHYDGRCR